MRRPVIERGVRAQDTLSGRIGTVIEEAARPGSWLVQFDGAVKADRVPASDLMPVAQDVSLSRLDRFTRPDPGKTLSSERVENPQNAPTVKPTEALPLVPGNFTPTITRETNPTNSLDCWVFHYPQGKKQYFGAVGLVRLRDQKRRYVGELARRTRIHISENQIVCPDPDPMETADTSTEQDATAATTSEPPSETHPFSVLESPATADRKPYSSMKQTDAMQHALRMSGRDLLAKDLATILQDNGYPFSSSNPGNSINVAANQSKTIFRVIKPPGERRSFIGLVEWGTPPTTAIRRGKQVAVPTAVKLNDGATTPAAQKLASTDMGAGRGESAVAERKSATIEPVDTMPMSEKMPELAASDSTATFSSCLPENPEYAGELFNLSVEVWSLHGSPEEHLKACERLEYLGRRIKRYREAKAITDKILGNWQTTHGLDIDFLGQEPTYDLWKGVHAAILSAMDMKDEART